MIKLILSILAIVTNVYAANFLDHYGTLGVTRQASARDIEKAYRRLRLKFNVVRGLFSIPALRRRVEIESAYHSLKNREVREKYDLIYDDLIDSTKKMKVLADLGGIDLAGKIETSVQLHAIQIAMDLDRADAVTAHYEELLQFASTEQIAALSMVAEAIGAAASDHYPKIRQFGNENQLAALRILIDRSVPVSDVMLDAAARIDTSARLFGFTKKLASHDGDPTDLLRRIATSCGPDLL